ncbi:MAG: (Fe-S)-binding protein [Campylobacterales bacterium]|nr:(Fe-S)-binding protein [Campylobacterales bacterium]
MKIGLFIPCYMNELYPGASMATLELLEKQGLDVEYPLEQTCCGQPMANTGCIKDMETLARRFVKLFKDYDYVVGPSGSCVSMVRNNYAQFLAGDPDFERIKTRTFEVCEFLHDVIKPQTFNVSFPYKVGLHNSCHSHRDAGLGAPSERNIPYFNKLEALLAKVDDIELVKLERVDECCGFGGTFAITESAISAFMGTDRIDDHLRAGAEIITGADLSCLMHMDGLIRRQGKPLRIIHIVQILNGGDPHGTPRVSR